jgi:hypothetical protein
MANSVCDLRSSWRSRWTLSPIKRSSCKRGFLYLSCLPRGLDSRGSKPHNFPSVIGSHESCRRVGTKWPILTPMAIERNLQQVSCSKSDCRRRLIRVPSNSVVCDERPAGAKRGLPEARKRIRAMRLTRRFVGMTCGALSDAVASGLSESYQLEA